MGKSLKWRYNIEVSMGVLHCLKSILFAYHLIIYHLSHIIYTGTRFRPSQIRQMLIFLKSRTNLYTAMLILTDRRQDNPA